MHKWIVKKKRSRNMKFIYACSSLQEIKKCQEFDPFNMCFIVFEFFVFFSISVIKMLLFGGQLLVMLLKLWKKWVQEKY